MDELRANALFLHEFRSISLMVFTESWLSSIQNDELVAVDGFKFFEEIEQWTRGNEEAVAFWCM